MHQVPVREMVDGLPVLELARSSVTDLELGHSARSAAEVTAMTQMLAPYTELPLSADVVCRARAVQRELADLGLRGREVLNLLIAATAELADATVVHYDQDFEIIASVTGQSHQWVVERGSID